MIDYSLLCCDCVWPPPCRSTQVASLSTTTADAPPPPLQIAAHPTCRSSFSRAFTNVQRIRAPLAPMGCPSDTEPPYILTVNGSMFSNSGVDRWAGGGDGVTGRKEMVINYIPTHSTAYMYRRSLSPDLRTSTHAHAHTLTVGQRNDGENDTSIQTHKHAFRIHSHPCTRDARTRTRPYT